MSDAATNNKAGTNESTAAPAKPRTLRATILQVLLVLNMVLVLLVAGVVLNIIPKPTLRASTLPPGHELRPAVTIDPQRMPADDHARRIATPRLHRAPTSQPVGRIPEESISWEQTGRLFGTQKYDKAFAAYDVLLRRSRQIPANRILADYFLLRMGQCLSRLGKQAEAREELAEVTQSRSPIVRALAWYEFAQLDLAERRYISARSKAYHAIAAMGAMDRPLAMEADCAFLIARTLTEKVRCFQTTKSLVRWPADQAKDPFAKLDKAQIREYLQEGVGLWTPSLDPSVAIRAQQNQAGRWRVNCSQVAIEDLINQFGFQAGKDVKWISAKGPVLRRSVNFYFRSVSSQKLSEVAAGMAGLIGRFTLHEIRMYDPRNAASTLAQRDLLTREAISAWRLFFLRHSTDPRIPDGQFALAAINEWSGAKIDAIHEYELLARRFKRSNVAPRALLRSAKIKIGMMNYAKARKDLIDLLDLYPDHPGVDNVYLMLAQVNETAGHFDEAIRSYEHLYFRNLSTASREAASMGAGRCYARKDDHANATKWLARYAALIQEPNPQGYVDAYFLMARSEVARGNYEMAVQAYRRGLVGRPPLETRIPALLELVSVHCKQENFIAAIGVLNHLGRENLTDAQQCRKAVLTAEVLRSLGLAEKARSVLKRQLSAVDTPPLRAMVGLELTQCHMDVEDYDSAQRILTEILPTLEDGRTLWLAEVLLAEVCLKMSEPDQAIRIAQKVRVSTAPADLQRWAAKVLGEAHLRKKEYEKAALAFSGLKKKPQPAKEAK